MSYAPETLRQARSFLLDAIPGMNPLSIGIVGDDRHAASGTSYHLGKDALKSGSYSVVESPRDRHPTDAAMALDVGWFSIQARGRTHTLRDFSLWLVAQCNAGAPDTTDIREVIYSPDGKTVRRWDRLGRRTSGDDTHLSHTHESWFRDSEGRDKTAVHRRWLTEIGYLEDNMPLTNADVDTILNRDAIPSLYSTAGTNPNVTVGNALKAAVSADVKLSQVLALLQALTGRDFTDEGAIVTGVLAGLDPAAIAAAIPAELARQVADELHARLAA